MSESVALSIQEYMCGNGRYSMQADSYGRRWYYHNAEGRQAVYIVFKHIWGGYKIFIIDLAHPSLAMDGTVPQSLEEFKNTVEAEK